MFQNYNKNLDNDIFSSNNIFNVSGQNIMTNNKNIEEILRENKKLKSEINKKNKEIENAKKKLNILQNEIQRFRIQRNKRQTKNRGKSVGIRNNNYINNYNNNEFNGGMFTDNDPFSDSFFNDG